MFIIEKRKWKKKNQFFSKDSIKLFSSFNNNLKFYFSHEMIEKFVMLLSYWRECCVRTLFSLTTLQKLVATWKRSCLQFPPCWKDAGLTRHTDRHDSGWVNEKGKSDVTVVWRHRQTEGFFLAQWLDSGVRRD